MGRVDGIFVDAFVAVVVRAVAQLVGARVDVSVHVIAVVGLDKAVAVSIDVLFLFVKATR